MGEFVRHEPCPACGSRDNLARYDDGSAYCFGCKHTEKGRDMTDAPKTVKSTKSKTFFTERSYRDLPTRKLTEETCRFFRYFISDGKQVAEYIRDGEVVAQKVRSKDKKFYVVGDGKNMPLFGQHLWGSSRARRLIITEGEVDALSVSQAQGNKWPVVSVPQGAHSAAKAVAREIEFVTRFEQVVIAFDMDEAGQEAAREVASILPPGKAYIAVLPEKDASACLQAGNQKGLIQSLWEAKAFRPDGVVGVDDVFERAVSPIKRGLDWPWPTLTRVTYGRRRSEVYGFGGGTGCGKTDAFKEVVRHILEHDNLPVGLVFLEEPPAHTLKTLAGKMDGVRYHVPDVTYNEDDLRRTVRSLDGRVFLYDHFGSMSWDTVKDKMRYMVRALGVRDLFLDHLTALAASVETDERKAIDAIMADLSSLAQELDATIYYISHLTRPEGKPHEEGGRVQEKHFRGSGAIGFWSHFLFGLERDKQKPDTPTTFRVLKDRYTGDANGVTFGLRYERETGRTVECELPAEGEAYGFGPAPTEDF